jgi:hypothetical protein
MVDHPNHFLAFLEGASYVATVGVLVVAIIGLKQLKISKDEARLNAKRDAARLANEQLKYYLEKIIPLQNELDEIIKKQRITIFKQSSFKREGDKLSVKLAPTDTFMDQLEKVVGVFVEINNALEAFSSYFTSALADEKIAFKAVGSTFCDSVKQSLPLIASGQDRGSYQNTIELYFMWQERLERQSLSAQKKELEHQLETMGGKEIIPLGTID